MDRPAESPHCRPAPPQNALDLAYKEINRMRAEIHRLAQSNTQLLKERESFCRREQENNRLEKFLETRTKQFNTEKSKNFTTLSKESEISKLKESLQFQQEKTEYQKIVDRTEEQIQQRDTIILDISKEEGLSQMHKVTTNLLQSKEAKLLESEKAWQAKYTALEEKFAKDLANSEQSWVTKVKLMEDKMKELEEKFAKDVAEREESWVTKVHLIEERKKELEEKFAKDVAEREESWVTKVRLIEERKKELEEKFAKDVAEREERWVTKVHLIKERKKELEEKFTKDLADKEKQLKARALSWQIHYRILDKKFKASLAKNKDLEDDKLELEELCLETKQKKRFFSFRKNRAEDRDTVLEKMKSKMYEKEMKKTAEAKKKERKLEDFLTSVDRKTTAAAASPTLRPSLANSPASDLFRVKNTH